jgi:hypothetical protein
MALLQFRLAGRNETAVPATVHCDHPTSCAAHRRATASDSGDPARASSTRWCSRSTRFPAA